MNPLVVSFGGGDQATITRVIHPTWPEFAKWLTTEPTEVNDKAQKGWYIPAEFDPVYRHSDNFVARHAITFDFDSVTLDTWGEVLIAWENLAFAIYTTYSHMQDGKGPRFRVVMPLSRPAGFDEYQALVRKVATDVGIELIARESFVPAQMMYCPTRTLGGLWTSHVNTGEFLNVDEVLAEYANWTDKASWPRRKDGDPVHAAADAKVDPRDKPGIIGEFNRVFSISAAIQRFELPYAATASEGRYTYSHGSRPEGCIIYDDDTKLHSHHDTDPARGQNSAYDLVRLHRFGSLDAGCQDVGISDRPSSQAMARFAAELGEVRAARSDGELEDLGELPRVTEELTLNEGYTAGAASGAPGAAARFLVHSAVDFGSGPPMDWVVRGLLPRAELAVIYGESGSGKSFLALDLCAAITRGIEWRARRTAKGRVVYVCAEGAGGFKTRLKAYARGHSVELAELPSVISDAPNLLDPKDAAAVTKAILDWGPVDVVVIDTLSATTPGGNENSGEDMGLVLSHCKFLHSRTGALVVLIHHSGKDATKGARGWSGLRAAADAEIEITRNGDFRSATVTKMKDGSDGESLSFKLKVIELGEVGGEIESSCVIEHVEAAPDAVAAGKQKPGGRHEVSMFDMLKLMAPSGTVAEEDLVAGYATKMPRGSDSTKDNRKRDAKRALEGLIAKRLAYMHAGDRVSLTSLVTSGEDGWLG